MVSCQMWIESGRATGTAEAGLSLSATAEGGSVSGAGAAEQAVSITARNTAVRRFSFSILPFSFPQAGYLNFTAVP